MNASKSFWITFIITINIKTLNSFCYIFLEKLFYTDEDSANEDDDEGFHREEIEVEHYPEEILLYDKFPNIV